MKRTMNAWCHVYLKPGNLMICNLQRTPGNLELSCHKGVFAVARVTLTYDDGRKPAKRKRKGAR